MPRYYCDYCDTYLTHDSPSVRKQHNAGYKHKANIRAYYQKFEQEQTQTLLDQKIKAHLGQAVSFQQVGAAYNQHLASFGGRPSLPVIPSPMLPIPGAAPSQLVPGIRPPILPRPVLGAPGYGMASMMAPVAGNPHATSTLPMQANNLQNHPILNTLATVSGGPSATGSNGVSSGSSAPPSNTAAGSYTYQEAPDRSH